MAFLLLLFVATAQAELKVKDYLSPLQERLEEKMAKSEAQAQSLEASMPSLYGTGNPEITPDSIDNMWKEGLDAMTQHTKNSLTPAHRDLRPTIKDQRRVRVLSDMHIGGCWARDKETQSLFMQMLQHMAAGNAGDNGPPITHLVMLGDIWDWWLVPLSEPIPQPSKLFQATDAYGYDVPAITDLIKRIGQKTKIYAVRGNHDDENNAALSHQAFGDAVQWMEDGFEMNGIWFEHGNIIDMYSNPPVAPDGQKKKGFGYFETRAGAEENGWQCKHKTRRPAGEKEEKYIDFMRKSVEMTDKPFMMGKSPASVMWSNWYLKNVVALPQNFVKTHLRWVLKQANPAFKAANYEAIPVTGFGHDQRVDFENQRQEYTLGDAIKDHTYDMELLANKFGSQHAMARLYASGLENHFKWFKSSRNHMLVVTGHTHNPYLARMRREKPLHSVSNDIVYANSGAWAQDSYQREHNSYLDIIMDQLGEAPHNNTAFKVGDWYPSKVQMYEYPATKPRDEQAIPYPRRAPGGFDLWLHPDPSEMVVGPPQDMGMYTPPGLDPFELHTPPPLTPPPPPTLPPVQQAAPAPVKTAWKPNQPFLKPPQPSWQ